jgi:hypothetical protein
LSCCAGSAIRVCAGIVFHSRKPLLAQFLACDTRRYAEPSRKDKNRTLAMVACGKSSCFGRV